MLAEQRRWIERMEAQPVRFMVRELEPALDAARAALGRFIGAPADDLGFVPNATSGINTVLRALAFKPGDELLTTAHTYNACRNALDFVAARWGARVTLADFPLPVSDAGAISAALLNAVTPRTRLALWCWSTRHKACPTKRRVPKSWAQISWSLAGTKCWDRRASAYCMPALSCSMRCRRSWAAAA